MRDLYLNQTIRFIQETFQTTNFIPLHVPHFSGKEKRYLNECIDTTFVSSVGKFVDQFEEQIATIAQTNRAVAVVNGTAGIQVALRLAGVSAGDEVLTQALTFVATANAIVYNNAHPVFLDVDIDTMGLSPRAVSDFLEEHGDLREDGCYNKTTGRKISACLPMHTFGFPVHLDELIVVCKKWNIPIVEDAAESLGSLYKGKPTGSFGELGVFSFNGNKIATSGGGGAIVTNNKVLADQGKYLTTTAKQPHAYEYYHDALGYNYRMPNINAALACAQLEQLQGFLEKKRKLASSYKAYFSTKGIDFRTETQDTKANYWLMCVELANKEERNLFLETTNAQGVMTRPIWQLMFRLPMYKDCTRDSQKNAIFLEERIVNIPSSVI
ncbi:LegC family aminotransferase [Winogradskyella poriferorum]|uniref:LegC family aminotransferase n=1 Tax=Winogradskyella poriferorum TaxID=307627 RepID=A0ABU7W0T0_9FLAO